jgi:hypothetical protein
VKINLGATPLDALYVGATKVYPSPAGGGGLPGLGGWAEVSDTPTSTYTDTAGVKWNVWTFTANGTLNVTKAGLLDVLLISGAAGSCTGLATPASPVPGDCGRVLDGVKTIPAGALAVVVGAAGANSADPGTSFGKSSKIGTLRSPTTTFGGTGSNPFPTAGEGTPVGPGGSWTGFHSSITGTDVAYGEYNTANPGATGSGGVHAGVVIVRRPA